MTGPIAAGSWHLVGDGIALTSADLRFSVLWRPAGTQTDQVMLTFEHHFDPNPKHAYDAVEYDGYATGAAFGEAGDLLQLKMEVVGVEADDMNITASDLAGTYQWVPNGSGSSAGGRLPSLTTP